jgi:hypothetical protein
MEAHVLMESSVLAVELLPEVGGKIGQIREKRTGRALLVAPQKPYRTIPAGGNWLEHDTSGMDDCFPNIAAGPYPWAPWAGTPLPDLGEWVQDSWHLASAGAREAVLERSGRLLPYRARKTVRFANERTLELCYRVDNDGPAALRYMWAAHPLIAAGEEFELLLPEGEKTFRTFPWDGRIHRWPRFSSTDLERQWVARGSTLKVFVMGLREGWCELRLAGCTLRFTFDIGATPVVGVWYNHLGFPGGGAAPFRCIAVEPCTSPSDLLDELEAGAYPAIQAGGRAEWWVRLEVRSTEA